MAVENQFDFGVVRAVEGEICQMKPYYTGKEPFGAIFCLSLNGYWFVSYHQHYSWARRLVIGEVGSARMKL
jgi:hypothetical protein